MNTESTAISTLILLLILGFLVFVFLGNGNEPETVTSDNTPFEQNTPSAIPLSETKTSDIVPKEEEPQPEPEQEINTDDKAKPSLTNSMIDDLIFVTSPVTYQKITSPLVIEGKARGFWFFEGDFPVMISNSKGNIIGRGQAKAKSGWMTQDFVQFDTELKFTPDYGKTGEIIIRNNNPSDIVENNREIRIPISFGEPNTIAVKVFFSNVKLDPNFSANKVFASHRVIPKTLGVARAALEELLKGPTKQEEEAGFFTCINKGVKIQKLSIVDGVARVDFDEQMEYQMGGSSRVSAIRLEVTQTLKQFSTVKEVIISVNGRTEDILQP